MFQDQLDLHRLVVFYTVVNEGTLSKAGERLFMSQPAISAHIKALEQQLGMPLFHREGRRAVVNKAGELLYKKAEQLFSVAEELRVAMENLKGAFIGRIALGCSAVWQYHLPRTLDVFKRKYPQVEVSLEVAGSDRIEKLVLDRSVDIGFMARPASRAELTQDYLGDDEVVPVCSPSHRLARAESVELSDLASEAFIVREPESATRHATDELLGALDLGANVAMELGSLEAIKQVAMTGYGIGMVSRQSVACELEAGRLVMLDIPQLHAPLKLHVAYLKHKTLTVTQMAFLDSVAGEGVPARRQRARSLSVP